MLLFWRSALLCVFMLHSSHTSMHADHLRPNRPGTQHYLNNESINAIHLPCQSGLLLPITRTCLLSKKRRSFAHNLKQDKSRKNIPRTTYQQTQSTPHCSQIISCPSVGPCQPVLSRAPSASTCHPPHST
jgi:hypothetical protein